MILDALRSDYADLGCTADIEITEVLRRDAEEIHRCILKISAAMSRHDSRIQR